MSYIRVPDQINPALIILESEDQILFYPALESEIRDETLAIIKSDFIKEAITTFLKYNIKYILGFIYYDKFYIVDVLSNLEIADKVDYLTKLSIANIILKHIQPAIISSIITFSEGNIMALRIIKGIEATSDEQYNLLMPIQSINDEKITFNKIEGNIFLPLIKQYFNNEPDYFQKINDISSPSPSQSELEDEISEEEEQEVR